MKLNRLFVFVLIVSMAMFSCEIFKPSDDGGDDGNNGKDTTDVNGGITTDFEDGNGNGEENDNTLPLLPIVTLDFEEANDRIINYNAIYSHGYGNRYFLNDTAILPAYFKIKIEGLHNWMQTKLDNDSTQLFASFALDSDSINLIFHDGSMYNPDTEVANLLDEDFYGFSHPCPPHCNSPNQGHETPITASDAVSMINAYDSLYLDVAEETVYYIKAIDAIDSMLISRYYRFNIADVIDILDNQNNRGNPNYFYASLGVELKQTENGHLDDTYVSDLIFHFIEPNSDGNLRDEEGLINEEGDGDDYYDATTPCPRACVD